MKIRLGTLKQITLQVLKFMSCEIPSNSPHLEAATAKNYFAKISSLAFRQYFVVGVLNEMLLNWFWYLICACKNQRDYFLIGIFIYEGGLKEWYGYCSMIIFFVLWVSAHYNKKRRSMNFMVSDLSRLNFFFTTTYYTPTCTKTPKMSQPNWTWNEANFFFNFSQQITQLLSFSLRDHFITETFRWYIVLQLK